MKVDGCYRTIRRATQLQKWQMQEWAREETRFQFDDFSLEYDLEQLYAVYIHRRGIGHMLELYVLGKPQILENRRDAFDFAVCLNPECGELLAVRGDESDAGCHHCNTWWEVEF